MKRRYEKLIDNLSKNLKDIEVKQAHCFSVIDITDDQKLIKEVVEDMINSRQCADERVFNEAIYKKLLRNPNLSKESVDEIVCCASQDEIMGNSSVLFDLISVLCYVRKLTLGQWEEIVNLKINRPTLYLELIEPSHWAGERYEDFLHYYFKIEKERLMEKRNNREEMKKKYGI